MKKYFAIAALVAVVGSAQATVHTFVPNPSNLGDLDHYKNYTWGINWAKPQGEVITEAVLTFKNIYDWEIEEDHLYVHLMDNPPLGVKVHTDDQGGGDAFAGQGPLIGVWSDPGGGNATGFNLVYKFSELGLIDDLDQFVQNGRFGFGVDPDCHYFNDGVKFEITTQAVPEPATMAALGVGALGLIRRRRSKKA